MDNRLVAMPTEIERYIRFQLEHLTAHNEHHTFEEISFRVAERRLSSNLLPATGPVSAGGDQGRDAESYHTSLPQEQPGTEGFVARATSEPLVVAVSVQRTGLETKIRADLKAICGQGEPVARVAFFAVQEISVAIRHRLQKHAREAHGVSLEVFDGRAVAHMLAQNDLIWVAQRYLDIPSHLVAADQKEHAVSFDRIGAQATEVRYGRVLAPNLAVFRQFREPNQVIARADASVLVFLLEEVIRLGAIDIAVDAKRYMNAVPRLPAVFGRRVVEVGRTASHAAAVRILRPIADEQQIVLDELLTMTWRKGSGTSEVAIAALMGLASNLEKLICGMRYGLQVDINISAMRAAVRILLESSRSVEARGNLITIEQVLSTYKPHRVGAVVCTSTSPPRLVELFLELAENPLYRELSENVRNMGFRGKVSASMTAVARIAQRLVEKKAGLELGGREVYVSSVNPAPAHSRVIDIFEADYFPPIVSMAEASKRAHARWKELEPQFIPVSGDKTDLTSGGPTAR
ncbi:hypothetical protein [Microbispora sp. CA-102843]|uniref:hypothetical protein n=1 Tax=Microbispora sp. CA-102843 TaxID=3239952 RepID=UPI003D8EC4F7